MGRACVERLIGRADHLLAVDLDAPDVDAAVGVACDISDRDLVAELASRARQLGPFRALVQPMMRVMLDATPVGRLGTAGEVAAVVAFLVSDEASFLTGVDVLVDGGCVQGLRGLAAAPGAL
jgi:NAD(P)-dependent dehydrogenase (short-subunit alcohol dehydrogenase family)